MQRYGFNAKIQNEEKEKARCDEMEQQLDKMALNELMEAAMKDGAITFNTKHSIIITKEERKTVCETEYKYILHIE